MKETSRQVCTLWATQGKEVNKGHLETKFNAYRRRCKEIQLRRKNQGSNNTKPCKDNKWDKKWEVRQYFAEQTDKQNMIT